MGKTKQTDVRTHESLYLLSGIRVLVISASFSRRIIYERDSEVSDGPSKSQIVAAWLKVRRLNGLSLGLTEEGKGRKVGGGKESPVTLHCFAARNSASFTQTQLVLPWALPM